MADPDWLAVAGCAAGYGPRQTVYGLFRRWQRNGTWRAVLTALLLKQALVRRRVDRAEQTTSAQGGGHVRMLGPDQRAQRGEDLLALLGRALDSKLLLGQQQVGAAAQGIRMISP